MLNAMLEWLGFGGHRHDHSHGHHHSHAGHGSHGDQHFHDGGHGHTHGVIDPSIATTERGIWAIKWSFIILMATAVAQLGIVYLSGSVALLADTIHNFGDAGTAIPLWIAFLFARKKPNRIFNYGYGRVEDLAGVVVVFLILVSAIAAGYYSIDRLINPQPIGHVGLVAAAGIVGFAGNEFVAVFRIRVGRQIDSVALIADGYHARVDGLTSVAVALGALCVWLGFPIADPIIGLVITAMIFGIVWQSAKAVFTRMLDGVEPHVNDEIRHAAKHVAGIMEVASVRARWLGHRLYAETEIVINETLSVKEGRKIGSLFLKTAKDHLPSLESLHVQFVKARSGDAGPGFATGGISRPEPDTGV